MRGINSIAGSLAVITRASYRCNLLHTFNSHPEFPFEKYSTVVDVGGGIGAFALPLAQTHKHIKITLHDLPDALVQARGVSTLLHLLSVAAQRFPRFGRKSIPRQSRRTGLSLQTLTSLFKFQQRAKTSTM